MVTVDGGARLGHDLGMTSDSSAQAFAKWEELIASFGAVPDPGLYDGRRLFAIWVRQFPIPDGVTREVIYPNGLPCLSLTPEVVETDRTILHIHGGAFASGNGSDFAALGARLALATGARVVLGEYRLAPEHPYPAAPDDCFAIYEGLLADGARAEAMGIGGDSAGATLALSTMVRVRDAGLPLPAAAALFSPWVDLSMQNGTYETIDDPTATRESLAMYLEGYLGDHDPTDPAVSPLFADLAGLPPLLVQAGTGEVFLGEARDLVERASSAGVAAELEVAEGMPHIWHLFASFLEEAEGAIGRIGSFYDGHLA